ncbi:hypothetical protein [Achromobacter insuavis]|uniref:hypothetical protein n=1 Tax=Achromobacter insuavis TaxID=1287735 RepID=UPI0035A10A68
MPNHNTTTQSRIDGLQAALRAIVAECCGPARPYSDDSYLPAHFLEAALAALEGAPTDDAGNWQQYRLDANETAAQIIERERAAYANLLQSVHDERRSKASAPVAGEVVTDEMVQAGAKAAREYFERTGGNDPAVIYRAMRAAAPAAYQASAGAFAKLQSAYVGACDRIGELLAEKQACANAAGEALVWRVSWQGGRRPTDWRDFATNPPPSAEYLARAGYTLQVAYAAPQAARAKASPEDLP